MANALHSSKTAEHFTPPEYIEAVRELLEVIELDPATSQLGNQVVRASKIYTVEDDGLAQTWHGRVFCNPPGGKGPSGESLPRKWWKKLVFSWEEGTVECGLFICFSLEILQRVQKDEDGSRASYKTPNKFPMLIPEERMRFWTEVNGVLVEGKQPTHSNAVVFLPRKVTRESYDPESPLTPIRFQRIFTRFGDVRL